MIDLTIAGLTPTQSKCYGQLAQLPLTQPVVLAGLIDESRTNTYKILESLEDLGLAVKLSIKNKIHYKAENPTKLISLAQKRKEDMLSKEANFENNIKDLTNQFFRANNQPGIRYYQGKEEIKEIFQDMLDEKQDIKLFRSTLDNSFLPNDFFIQFKKKRANIGINTELIGPPPPEEADSKNDNSYKIKRYTLPKDVYNLASEINVYGDKTAIISYGTEAFGVVINSKQIATSLSQLFDLVKLSSSKNSLN